MSQDHEAPGGSPLIDRLNRYVLVVTPRQPWVDWALGLGRGNGDGTAALTLEEAAVEHQATFLVPFAHDTELVVEWIRDNVDLLFEQMLHSLEPDTAHWPRDRSPEVFEDWFSMDLLDAPIDLVDAPLYAPPGEDPEDEGEDA